MENVFLEIGKITVGIGVGVFAFLIVNLFINIVAACCSTKWLLLRMNETDLRNIRTYIDVKLKKLEKERRGY